MQKKSKDLLIYQEPKVIFNKMKQDKEKNIRDLYICLHTSINTALRSCPWRDT